MAAVAFAELYARGLASAHAVDHAFAGLDPKVQSHFVAATRPRDD